jgi:predicted amino acid dehydrogenase
VKQIIQISLGPSLDDIEFETEFLKQPFHIRRLGTDGDVEQASDLLLKWNKRADAIALGGIRSAQTMHPKHASKKDLVRLLELGSKLETPVTSGNMLRLVGHEWSLRHIQFKLGNNYFNNARVFFFSGRSSRTIAKVMAEYSQNLIFADALLENGVPKLVDGLKDFKLYNGRLRDVLAWVPGKSMFTDSEPVRRMINHLLRQAVHDAHILVVPHHQFFKFLDPFSIDDLKSKTVITSTVYDDRIDYLKDKGVDVIIDTTPKLLDSVAGVSVLEAMLRVAFDIPKGEASDDELLEIISNMQMEPRIIYPAGKPKRVNRFAYVIHPPSQDYLKKLKPVEVLSDLAPGMMNTVEKVMAYAPPFVYSTVRGIRSKTGVEAEGWLIALGVTPEQMQAHGPEFTTKRILEAAEIAKKKGAQIMGIGLLPKAMKDTSLDVAKHAVLPITTGNSYFASSALWAGAEAVRKMGMTRLKHGKVLRAKAMVVGATGAVGVICSHLLARAFEEIYLVGRNIAKLLALQESVQKEVPSVKLRVSTRADKNLSQMDMIVATSSGARAVLDIMQIKPGGVIVDINLPSIFTKETVAKRPDVMIIRGGEIRLPGDHVEMKDIGLPPGVVYAGLAETITLALEGRFEVFTVGAAPQWDKVREIYRLGLKHGMQLAAISGVDGIYSDEEITRAKALAIKERNRA